MYKMSITKRDEKDYLILADIVDFPDIFFKKSI